MQSNAYPSTSIGDFELGMLIELEEYTTYTRKFVPGKGIVRMASLVRLICFSLSIPILSFSIFYFLLIDTSRRNCQNCGGESAFSTVMFLFSVLLIMLAILLGRVSKSKQTGHKYTRTGSTKYSLYIENMVIMFNRLCQWSYNVDDPNIKQRLLSVEFELSRVIRNLNMQRNLMLATVAGAGAATIMGARSFVRNLK